MKSEREVKSFIQAKSKLLKRLCIKNYISIIKHNVPKQSFTQTTPLPFKIKAFDLDKLNVPKDKYISESKQCLEPDIIEKGIKEWHKNTFGQVYRLNTLKFRVYSNPIEIGIYSMHGNSLGQQITVSIREIQHLILYLIELLDLIVNKSIKYEPNENHPWYLEFAGNYRRLWKDVNEPIKEFDFNPVDFIELKLKPECSFMQSQEIFNPTFTMKQINKQFERLILKDRYLSFGTLAIETYNTSRFGSYIIGIVKTSGIYQGQGVYFSCFECQHLIYSLIQLLNICVQKHIEKEFPFQSV